MSMISYTEKNGVIIVQLYGDMNIGVIDEVEATLGALLAKRPTVIALDCSGLNSIDSTMVSLLVKFLSKTKANNIRLIFFDLNKTIRHTFEVMQLTRFFTITSRMRFDEEYGGVTARGSY